MWKRVLLWEWVSKMDNLRAIEIIKSLADGVDPFTGEIFPPDSPYQNIHTVRALYRALETMGKKKQKINRPVSAGSKWSDEESQLLAKQFDSGTPILQIAKEHQRTKGAIAARLVRIGKIASRDEVLLGGKYKKSET